MPLARALACSSTMWPAWSQHALPVRNVTATRRAPALVLVVEGELLPEGGCQGPTRRSVVVGCAGGSPTRTAVAGRRWLHGVSSSKAYHRRAPNPLTIAQDALPWQEFEDPAGRPTQPVQVLLEGELSALRTRFDPAYIAGEHWHDYPTLYFITDGRMRFGHEGWYDTGDIRAVAGGFSYGPEQPGRAGVEFVLLSIGGPVNLHWADLEDAPNGPLP